LELSTAATFTQNTVLPFCEAHTHGEEGRERKEKLRMEKREGGGGDGGRENGRVRRRGTPIP
jgi:hypothetical protein